MIYEYLSGWEKHLRILRALSDATIENYKVKVVEFFYWLQDEAGKDDFLSATQKDFEKYLEWCFYKNNSNYTRQLKLIALRSFYRYLHYEGEIKKDPTALIPNPRIAKKFVQKFTQKEILKLFAEINLESERGIRDAVILILGVFGGLRNGEICRLRNHDIVEYENNHIEVNIIDSKWKGSRVVDFWKAPSMIISKQLAIRLSESKKGSDFFLVSVNKRQLTQQATNQLLKKYANKAKLRKPEINMHMLRATHASDLRNIRGYDIAAIADRLGHRDIATTDRYIPSRTRISKIYPSLANYWKDFPKVWG